jgi:hypothetical protein
MKRLILIQNEPDRKFVRPPGLASTMGEPSGLLSGYPPQSRKFGRFHNSISSRLKTLNVPELFLSHAKIVPQFVHERLADLMAHFRFAGTDRFNVLLIKHDVRWPHRNIKEALLRR